jgi:SAM-dependent methyltransferase
MVSVIERIKRYGVKRCIEILVDRFSNENIRGFVDVDQLFRGKNGLEIGGPSRAFSDRGYLPIYRLANVLDGVNFSDSTVWTGKTDKDMGYVIDGNRIGDMYIADATDLSCIADNKYDFLLSSNNIEHIANPLKALHEWTSRIKPGGALAIVAPRKEANFDHRRDIVDFKHLLEDYNNKIDEHDLTHLGEILELHDLSMDPPAGDSAAFKRRCLQNFENRCMHHHVFDLDVLQEMCNHLALRTVLMEQRRRDYVIIAARR